MMAINLRITQMRLRSHFENSPRFLNFALLSFNLEQRNRQAGMSARTQAAVGVDIPRIRTTG